MNNRVLTKLHLDSLAGGKQHLPKRRQYLVFNKNKWTEPNLKVSKTGKNELLKIVTDFQIPLVSFCSLSFIEISEQNNDNHIWKLVNRT